jgi:hypothetical protein
MQGVVEMITIAYVVLGAGCAISGLINIAGGIAALRFRSRTFVIVALFFNVAALPTCWCAPTSLGILIWGLVVMFQKDVADAFKLGAAGYAAQEIRDRMSRDDDDRYDDRHDDDRPSSSDPPRPKEDRGHDGFREL